jgi:hypothetical protein
VYHFRLPPGSRNNIALAAFGEQVARSSIHPSGWRSTLAMSVHGRAHQPRNRSLPVGLFAARAHRPAKNLRLSKTASAASSASPRPSVDARNPLLDRNGDLLDAGGPSWGSPAAHARRWVPKRVPYKARRGLLPALRLPSSPTIAHSPKSTELQMKHRGAGPKCPAPSAK